jgi:hypothetical protein
MAITRSQMKRQLYSIGGGAIKGTDAGNGREGFFKPIPGSPMANLLNTLPPNDPRHYGIGFGPIQLGGFGGMLLRQKPRPMSVSSQGGEQAVYPRLGDLRSGVSSAEQELQQINQSIDQVQSDLGSPTGGEFGDFSSIINPIRPSVQGSSMSSIYSNNYIGDRGSEQSSPIGQIMGFGGVGDPRSGAPYVPNSLQQIMRGGAANGGMMGRQMYGLGSLVKSAVKGVTSAVKSIAKSDLGKAALLIGGGMYAGGLGPFAAAGRFGSIPGAGFASGIPSLIKGGVKTLGLGVPAGGKPTLGQFGKVFALGSLGGAALEALTASGADEEELENIRDPETLRAYLRRGYKQLNPGAEPEQIEEFVTANTTEYAANGGRIGYNEGTDFQKWLEGKQKFEQGQNFEQLYREYLEDKRRQKVAEQKTMAANGGRIGYAFGNPEDNAMRASGIMNLPLNQNPAGVTELDLRDSGGFIPPVGVKEKADDIPAMLSNNEFVFTAESVRNMGNGDVNKGAQRMYDMMKYLEKGGRV